MKDTAAMSTDHQRLEMANFILNAEARRDQHNRLSIYRTSDDDGNDTFEVAGIHNNYHPLEARELSDLINAGYYDEAEQKALHYIALWTDHVTRWTSCASFESFLRDCSFQRGPYGAARMLQFALNEADTGDVTQSQIDQVKCQENNQQKFLIDLRMARERYEREICQRNETNPLWLSLLHRWSNALDFATHFCPQSSPTPQFHYSTALTQPHQSTPMTGNFFTNVISRDPRFHSTERIDDPMLLEPNTREKVMKIISDARHLGIELMIYETYRSAQRQKELFEQGASKIRFVGVHHYGLACDLVKRINGEPNFKGDFEFLGQLARKNRMIWGGDWGHPGLKPSFYDGDHVQRIAVHRQTSLFDGSWYPDDNYDPWTDLVA